jgi:complement component 1 Q subcomponent-binding protein
MSLKALRPLSRAAVQARSSLVARGAFIAPRATAAVRAFSISQRRLGNGESKFSAPGWASLLPSAGVSGRYLETRTSLLVRGLALYNAKITGDSSLSAAITAEHSFELETAASQPEIPEFLDTFRSQRTWEIEDNPGADDVILTRKFGNER